MKRHLYEKMVIVLIMVVLLAINIGNCKAAEPAQLFIHLKPGQQLAVFGWGECARYPDESCDGLDLTRGHISDLVANGEGIVVDSLTYDFVKIYRTYIVKYIGGLSYAREYQDVVAVVGNLKYTETPVSVDIWPTEWDPILGENSTQSYTNGSVVVFLSWDPHEIIWRINRRITEGQQETEDLWKREVFSLAGIKWPDW